MLSISTSGSPVSRASIDGNHSRAEGRLHYLSIELTWNRLWHPNHAELSQCGPESLQKSCDLMKHSILQRMGHRICSDLMRRGSPETR